MHGNQIANLHDVLKLAKLENLQKLTLHGNPIAEGKNYKMWCVHWEDGNREKHGVCRTEAVKYLPKLSVWALKGVKGAV